MKRGLVLEGGGAKGAYEFGCLVALKERGIRVDAVAGTSIGAINGLLWATDQVYDERRTWAELNEDTAFTKRYPTRFLRGIVMFYNNYRNSFEGLTHSSFPNAIIALPRRLYILGTVSVGAIFFSTLSHVFALTGFTEKVIDGIAVVGSLLLLFDVVFWSAESFKPYFKLLVIGLIWLLVLIHAPHIERPQMVRELLLATTASVVFVFYLGYWRFSRDITMERGPLRALVSRVLASGIKLPLYVTLAEEESIYDLDRPVWREAKTPKSHLYWLEPQHTFFAKYFPLHGSPANQNINVVLASAALPFGITKSIAINGKSYVDGGVADNRPIYPLVVFEQCTEILVIRLNPEPLEVTGVMTQIQ